MDREIIVPLHVSGVWIPVYSRNIRESGSLGAGLNLRLYVRVKGFKHGDCYIRLNGGRVLRDHAEHVCRGAGVDLGVDLYSPIDLGVGYGVSAASVLAHAMTIALYMEEGFERYAVLAHEAEVLYSTGLGDVIAEYHGGAEIRVKPGAPGVGVVKDIPVKGDESIIACILPGGESTPSMLRRIGGDVYRYGYMLWEELRINPSLKLFFESAQRFTRRIFDYSLVDELLEDYLGGIYGYYRKKQALIIWCRRGDILDRLHNYLTINGLKCFKTGIDRGGARIVYPTKPSTPGEPTG